MSLKTFQKHQSLCRTHPGPSQTFQNLQECLPGLCAPPHWADLGSHWLILVSSNWTTTTQSRWNQWDQTGTRVSVWFWRVVCGFITFFRTDCGGLMSSGPDELDFKKNQHNKRYLSVCLSVCLSVRCFLTHQSINQSQCICRAPFRQSSEKMNQLKVLCYHNATVYQQNVVM